MTNTSIETNIINVIYLFGIHGYLPNDINDSLQILELANKINRYILFLRKEYRN